MSGLVEDIEKLKRSEIHKLVNARMSEFRVLGGGDPDKIFDELSFCIMTANFNAQRSIDIQKAVGGFRRLGEKELASMLKEGGHRFPAARAKYIADAQEKALEIAHEIMMMKGDEQALRKWLAENVRGIGYKEASHFMRNIGFTDVAIIDFHIIDLLVRRDIIERPKTLTPKKYLEVEAVLRGIAKKAGLNLAELDLYLWYMETGKILK
ncbi:MAG: N-glycosylase/DNA lyase [Candidatus Aenigmarchaeota archaeon]|nr:N-glycosylase/DNA lyase [Candidatus Aenigmarchaeota archaeon]